MLNYLARLRRRLAESYPRLPKPPLTAAEFIERYRRDWVNPNDVMEVVFWIDESAEREYLRMSADDRIAVLDYARKIAASVLEGGGP